MLGGLSLGGYVALAFMRRHADRVSGLVLLDTKATADGDQARADRLKMAERVLAEGNDFVPEVMLPSCSARPAASTGRRWSRRSPP